MAVVRLVKVRAPEQVIRLLGFVDTFAEEFQRGAD